MSEMTQLQQAMQAAFPQTELRMEEPLALHTSFKIGGPCEVMAFPRTIQELSARRRGPQPGEFFLRHNTSPPMEELSRRGKFYTAACPGWRRSTLPSKSAPPCFHLFTGKYGGAACHEPGISEGDFWRISTPRPSKSSCWPVFHRWGTHPPDAPAGRGCSGRTCRPRPSSSARKPLRRTTWS